MKLENLFHENIHHSKNPKSLTQFFDNNWFPHYSGRKPTFEENIYFFPYCQTFSKMILKYSDQVKATIIEEFAQIDQISFQIDEWAGENKKALWRLLLLF